MWSLVQYVIVRTDLITDLGWTRGEVIAQACNATNAVFHKYENDYHVQSFFAGFDDQQKVVLGINSEKELLKLCRQLELNFVDHKLWVDKKRRTPTCIAIKPYPKATLQHFVIFLKVFE